jgi:Flp pilus assembly protein CpaB
MTYRARNIVLAVALAVVAALLTGFYVTNYKRTVQHGEHHVSVYVAAKDIPAGTSGADVARGGYLKKVDVPRRAVVPGAISNPNQVQNSVAGDTVYAGEQVSTRRFTTTHNAGVRGQLKGPQRAIEVNGNATQLLAGTLKAGDHVDLVGNFKLNDSGSNSFSRIVLRDLLVLQAPAVSGGAGKLDPNQQNVTAMLRLTDTQVQKFWFTVNNADGKALGWSLELRPVVDPTDSPEVLEWLKTVMLDGLNRYQINRALNGGLR